MIIEFAKSSFFIRCRRAAFPGQETIFLLNLADIKSRSLSTFTHVLKRFPKADQILIPNFLPHVEDERLCSIRFKEAQLSLERD
jgi:hypothetical protein